MKRLCFGKQRTTKRGVASLYVVIFATMVFGIVSLSCMRIMLSEVTQSNEDDQSRSAYDAAMAGVEDAKTAVNLYYKCLSNPGSSSRCNSTAKDDLFHDKCNDFIGVAKYLYSSSSYNPTDGNTEVLIQENSTDNNSDQAYTCVMVSDITPDYRGALTKDTRTRVIPLSVKTANSDTDTSLIGGVKRVRFSWFSQLNEGEQYGGSNDFANLNNDGKLGDSGSATVPPTIALTLLVAKKDLISPENFHKANNGADYSTVVLLPSGDAAWGAASTRISNHDLSNAGEATTVEKHEPVLVQCSKTAEFACTVDLEVSFEKGDSVFLIASLPYGETIADFSVSMYANDNNSSLIDFQGSQILVDSTGRTGQLFRRVETRLEPSDLYFPYPMYALDLGDGDDEGSLSKNFWITANCWYTRKIGDSFEANECNNNNNATSNY